MKIPPLNTLCCMRPDCTDSDCPGRILNTRNGGHQYSAGVVFPSEREVPEFDNLVPSDRVLLGAVGAALIVLAAALMQAAGITVTLIF